MNPQIDLNMKSTMKKCVLASLMAVASLNLSAEVRLPSVICDGMVLQRGQPISIWGWADSDENFTLCWRDACYLVTADSEGRWELTLPAEKAGGPYSMSIGEKEINDILVGDVFLCSGQSNMELPIRRVTDMFAEEVAEYENNRIRQYIVPKVYDFNRPQEDTPASSWKTCTQENVMEFSALAYFFAKEMYAANGVPVGIINASWGGTPVEAWMSEEALAPFPRHINEKRIYEDEGYRRRIKELEGEEFYRWNTALHKGDPGFQGERKWYDPDFDDSSWKVVHMFSKDWGNDGLNPVGGSHWFRKDFLADRESAGKDAVLRLGCIVDSDSVYVNGKFVGTTGYQYPPRIYRIPAGTLKEGRNNVTVRIISNGGEPHFVQDKPYKVICGDHEISLEGNWRYCMGAPMPPAPSMMFFCYKPVCLYNAMIAPLSNLNFKAVLWYQGESNVDRRNEYTSLLKGMIQDWRETFGDEDLPFYIVELADFLHESDKAGRAAWQEMRQMQAEAAKGTSNAVLIRNCDLGEWNDIHPLDKKTLGKRAAEAVLENMD